MTKIMSIAQNHNLTVVEDAAQALGSTFNGQHGTFGVGSAISFFPQSPWLSDGGAILCQDESFMTRFISFMIMVAIALGQSRAGVVIAV